MVTVRTALVVVDMLNDFLDGIFANPATAGIVEPIRNLAAQARADEDWSVFYVSDAHVPEDLELRVFPAHAMAGTHGSEVIRLLRPQPGDTVVPKHFYSGFTGTTLEAELRSQAVERLVLVGQHTDCCVRHTCFDAFTRGFEMVVCPDGTAVYEPGSDVPPAVRQEQALEYLVTYYGVRLEGTGSVG